MKSDCSVTWILDLLGFCVESLLLASEFCRPAGCVKLGLAAMMSVPRQKGTKFFDKSFKRNRSMLEDGRANSDGNTECKRSKHSMENSDHTLLVRLEALLNEMGPRGERSKSTTLKYGSMFSGWDSGAQALEVLGVKYSHEFCIDKCPSSRKILERSFKPKKIFADIKDVDITKDLPKVDLFQFSPSCVPYSTGGKSEGTCHDQGDHCLKGAAYINCHNPDAWIMEQVVPFQTAASYSGIRKKLYKAFKRSGNYHTQHCVLNASTHGGLPQNRSRLFIIGLKKTNAREHHWFQVPRPIPCLPLHLLLDSSADQVPLPDSDIPKDMTAFNNLWKVLDKIKKKKYNPMSQGKDLWVADLHSTNPCVQQNRVMCITASRASAKGFYILGLLRWTTIDELVRLQGVKDGRLNFQALRDSQIGKLCGNAIPVTLLVRIFEMVLPKITDQPLKKTPWSGA